MPPRVTFRAAAAAFAIACGLVSAETETGQNEIAGNPDWIDTRYGYVANNESLGALLYDFGTSLDIPVFVSANIDYTVDDSVPVMTAEEFLAELHTRFGLIWIFDGNKLHLYDGTESVRETVDFPFSRREAFKDSIVEARLRGAPLNWVFLPAENRLQLSGPPRFVEWGSKIAGELAEEDSGWSGRLTPEEDLDHVVRLFPVKYGYVDQVDGGGGPGRVASLAEMVAKLMNVSHVADVIGITTGEDAARPPAKLRGSGVIPEHTDTGRKVPSPSSRVTSARGEGQEAFVIGDPRLNAIIVRDRSYRMPIYERLIRELDNPLDQLEIGVSVLDIDASAAEELSFGLESDSLQVNALANDEGSTFYYAQNQWDIDGLALRVRALRSAGKSRILTRPSVTTLDNHEASFQNNRTFYVRLGGNDAESVDLARFRTVGWYAFARTSSTTAIREACSSRYTSRTAAVAARISPSQASPRFRRT